jgi:oxygen-dependent protoporphyrinogen oxidase
LTDRLAEPDPEGAWVRLGNDTVPLPKAGLLGIPSSPLAADVIRAIGWSGALRAYLDRVMPILKIGQERNLGALVRKRMGSKVLDRLVAPVATGVYSAEPDELDVAVVAPGLNQAITRAGSLSGGVATLRSAAKAGSAVGGLVGGLQTLVVALEADVIARGGRILMDSPVVALEPSRPPALDEVVSTASETTDDEIDSIDENETELLDEIGSPALGGNQTGALDGIEIAQLDEGSGPDADPGSQLPEPRWIVRLADGEAIDADAVIVAAPGPVALRILAPADAALGGLADLGWPEASSVELATLVVDVPELASHPRGTGILVAEDAGGVQAKALTHATAKWAWLAEAAGEGRHVVRLSYGRAGKPSETADLDDGEFRELARRDASELLGIPIPESSIVGFARTRWTNALPFAAVGERERIAAVRDAVAEVDGLEVTGAWLTGTGLASVVPNAREASRAVRGLRWRELAGKD